MELRQKLRFQGVMDFFSPPPPFPGVSPARTYPTPGWPMEPKGLHLHLVDKSGTRKLALK